MRSTFASLVVVVVGLVPVGFVACAGSDDPHDDGSRVGSDALVEQVYTVDGWMSLEDAYIPRVCTQENGGAATEALKAQAIAARTYLLRAMRDDPTLGTTQNPVVNGQSFQAYAAQANAGCVAATQATRSVVGEYQGELVIANYVAGALWDNGGPSSDDPTGTEHWVTYNDGLTGGAVHPTALSYTARPDNRGCMSQNGSDALAQNGEGYEAILRYFYGADLQLVSLEDGGNGSGGGSSSGAGGDDSSGSGGGSGDTGGDSSPWTSSDTSEPWTETSYGETETFGTPTTYWTPTSTW